MSDILISEIFGPTIQGEGALAGRLTVFVRTGGCDFRCDWCVAPETPILLSDQSEKRADEIEVGDQIWSMARRPDVPETVGPYQIGEVQGVATRTAPRVRVTFEDGRELVAAQGHALTLAGCNRFLPVEELRAADTVLSFRTADARVARVEMLEEGEVVSLKTSLGTYISNGLLSRNCDTLYAVLPQFKRDWTKMSASQIIERIEEHSFGQPILVTVSGGNPALQPLDELLDLGHERGHTFALETQGTKSPDWLERLDFLTISPKPPSSKMEFDEQGLRRCLEIARRGKTAVSLKVVAFDDADYEFARSVWRSFPDVPFYLSAGTVPAARAQGESEQITKGVEWLIERAARDGWREAVILPQIHVLLWGQKRGV